MGPNWMLAGRKCVSVGEESRQQTVGTLNPVSLTIRLLSDKARLLWRLRGTRP